MGNPFTDLSRDARLAVNLPGFCTKLRSPDVLHSLTMAFKPDHIALGDHLLAALLDHAILALMMRRDYRGIYGLLGTLFAGHGPDGTGAGQGRAPGA